MALIAVGAGLLLGLALVLLATFFMTRDARFDRGAEWAFVAFAVLAIPTILTVGDRIPGEGVVISAITWIGIAGVAVMGFGELAVTLRLVGFQRVSGLVTIGFLSFLSWIGGASILAIVSGGLPSALAWLGVAAIVVGIAITAFMARQPGVMSGEQMPGRGVVLAALAPIAAVVAWLIGLGMSL